MGLAKKNIICQSCFNLMIDVYCNRKYCDNCRKEKRAKYIKQYQQTNKEKVNEKSKRWRQSHPDQMKMINKKCNEKNPEKKKEYNSRYREKHKEILKEKSKSYNKKYYSTKKGKMSSHINRIKRRERMNNVSHSFSYDEWLDKLNKTNGICPNCNKYIGIDNLTMDHIIPVSKSKINFVYSINDVQPLCKLCNCSKNNMII